MEQRTKETPRRTPERKSMERANDDVWSMHISHLIGIRTLIIHICRKLRFPESK
jgi:hypothetical protein